MVTRSHVVEWLPLYELEPPDLKGGISLSTPVSLAICGSQKNPGQIQYRGSFLAIHINFPHHHNVVFGWPWQGENTFGNHFSIPHPKSLEGTASKRSPHVCQYGRWIESGWEHGLKKAEIADLSVIYLIGIIRVPQIVDFEFILNLARLWKCL